MLNVGNVIDDAILQLTTVHEVTTTKSKHVLHVHDVTLVSTTRYG